MKVTYVVPGPEMNVYKIGGIVIPSVGVASLARVNAEAGHQVRVFDENVMGRVVDSAGKLRKDILDTDVLGVSMLTPAAPRGYRYLDQARKRNPNIVTMAGGWHVTAMPEEAAGHADFVVTGEAEDLINPLVEGRYSRAESTAGRILNGGTVDVDQLPFPDFTLYHGYRKIRYFPVGASRGCPYNCSFCPGPSLFKQRHRSRDSGLVAEELKMRSERGEKRLFFTDDLFGLDAGATGDYLENSLSRGIAFPEVSAETRANIIFKNRELLPLMKRIGFRNVHVGCESAIQENLDSTGKKQSTDEVRQAVQAAHRAGIEINGMFIIGMENDDEGIVEVTRKFIEDNDIDSTTFSCFYPIPGSRDFGKFDREERIITRDWSLYDGAHAVIRHRNLSPYRLQRLYLKMWREAYRLRRLFSRYPQHVIAAHVFSRIVWPMKSRGYLRTLKRGDLAAR